MSCQSPPSFVYTIEKETYEPYSYIKNVKNVVILQFIDKYIALLRNILSIFVVLLRIQIKQHRYDKRFLGKELPFH